MLEVWSPCAAPAGDLQHIGFFAESRAGRADRIRTQKVGRHEVPVSGPAVAPKSSAPHRAPPSRRSQGRYQKRAFRKALCPIVERLCCSMMMHGRNNGKKLMAVRIVKHAFEIIHLLTDKNPIQVYVDAVKNGGPREDAGAPASCVVQSRRLGPAEFHHTVADSGENGFSSIVVSDFDRFRPRYRQRRCWPQDRSNAAPNWATGLVEWLKFWPRGFRHRLCFCAPQPEVA